MLAKRISSNETIGIICPSHIADIDRYSAITASLQQFGFQVKLGANIYKDTYGFVASAEERAQDLNSFINDKDIKMILFGGGEGAAEILSLIDYSGIKRYPKLFSSYSDGTSILNAIYAQTGLITYYGLGTGEFENPSYYSFKHFNLNFVDGYKSDCFEKGSNWTTICRGKCEGILIGGYAPYFGLMLSNRYFNYNPSAKYLLFLEDCEKFSSIGAVCSYLAFIEQSEFIHNVTGMIFGHYADRLPDDLLHSFERFGKRNNIPVVYTNDFGHGLKHAVLPIGVYAELDADKQSLNFLDFER